MIWVITALIIALLLAVAWVGLHNTIVRADNKCDVAWQVIEAQLQRCCDLIPLLLETVRGCMRQESETLNAVTAARAALTCAATPEDKIVAADALADSLTTLFTMAEGYPELAVDDGFARLQSELLDVENRINRARVSFNDMVLDYNNAIQAFPGRVIAGTAFQERRSFGLGSQSVHETTVATF